MAREEQRTGLAVENGVDWCSVWVPTAEAEEL